MTRLKSMRPTVAVLVAAILIVAAGGAAVASNMGFKMNKPLVRVGDAPNAFFTGIQYVSIPFHNPYGTINGFCLQTGLVSTGLTRTRIQAFNYTAPNQTLTCNCGNPAVAACAQALIPGKMLEIRQPSASVAGSANSMIIVGSHNSSIQIPVVELENVFYSVPFHTTAVTALDLCNQIGLSSTGINRGTVERLKPNYVPPEGPFQTYACGTAGPFNLVLGEGVRIRQANNQAGIQTFSFNPAHY
jgi:hypothetical protein